MSILQWPNQRVTYPGIDNPMFVDDIQVADENIFSAAIALLGALPTDFFILTGFTYDGTQYTNGIAFLNGSLWYNTNNITEGQYMVPSTQTALSEAFEDGISRPIYTNNFLTPVGAPVAGSSPQFTGSMDNYRIGGKRLLLAVNTLQTIAANLKSAAFADIGQNPGQVAAANDPRLVYTAAQLDSRYAQQSAVIVKGAGTTYTPAAATDPANKGYVDNNTIQVLAKGYIDLGDADTSGGTIHTLSLGVTLGTTNYKVLFDLESLSVNPAVDTFYHIPVRNKTLTSFDLYFREASAGVQHVAINWVAVAM